MTSRAKNKFRNKRRGHALGKEKKAQSVDRAQSVDPVPEQLVESVPQESPTPAADSESVDSVPQRQVVSSAIPITTECNQRIAALESKIREQEELLVANAVEAQREEDRTALLERTLQAERDSALAQLRDRRRAQDDEQSAVATHRSITEAHLEELKQINNRRGVELAVEKQRSEQVIAAASAELSEIKEQLRVEQEASRRLVQQLQEAQAENSKASAKINAAESQRTAKAEREVKELAAQISLLTSERATAMQSAESEKQELQLQVSGLTADITRLSTNIAEITAARDELQTKATSNVAAIEQLKQAKAEQERVARSEREEFGRWSAKMLAIAQQEPRDSQKVSEKVAFLSGRIGMAESQLGQCNSRVKSFNHAAGLLVERLHRLEQRASDAEKRHASLLEERAVLERKIATVEQQRISDTAAAKASEGETTRHNVELLATVAQLQKQQGDAHGTADGEKKDLEKRLSELRTVHEAMKERMASDANANKAALEKAESRAESAESLLSQLQGQLTSVLSNNKTKSELDQQRFGDFWNKVMELTRSTTGRIVRLVPTEQSIGDRVRLVEVRLGQSLNRVRELRQAADAKEQRIVEAEQRLDSVRMERDELQHQLSDLEDRNRFMLSFTAIETALTTDGSKIESLREQLSSQTAESEAAKEENGRMTREVDDMMTAVKESEKQLTAKNAELFRAHQASKKMKQRLQKLEEEKAAADAVKKSESASQTVVAGSLFGAFSANPASPHGSQKTAAFPPGILSSLPSTRAGSPTDRRSPIGNRLFSSFRPSSSTGVSASSAGYGELESGARPLGSERQRHHSASGTAAEPTIGPSGSATEYHLDNNPGKTTSAYDSSRPSGTTQPTTPRFFSRLFGR